MFEDRFVPAADDLEDAYELKREESRSKHSHKHDKHKKKHKKDKDRERSRSRGRASKEHSEGAGKRSSRHKASPELEDGEVLEDGEIYDGDDGEGQPRLQRESQHAEDELNARVEPPDVANGKHRSSENGSAGHDAHPLQHSSKPSRDRSRDHKSSRALSRERSRERSSSRREQESGQPGPARHSSREPPVPAAADRCQPHGSEAEGGSRLDKERERDSSRRLDREHGSSRQGEREYTRDGSRMDKERDRGSSRQRDRGKPEQEREYGRDSSKLQDREVDGSRPREEARQALRDSSRQRDRERYDRDRLDRDRLDRDRDRLDRDRLDRDRHREDWRHNNSTAGGRDEYRRRSDRSRSREARRGSTFEERERDRQKRSRDGRDNEYNKRRRRSESDSEPELDLDPNALMEVDPLGLSQAEKEEQERQRRLEESRRRRQEILAKHQQTAGVVAPTATAASAGAAVPGTDLSLQQQQQQQTNAAAAAPSAAAVVVVAGANAAGDAVDGTATPEGNRSSSEDSHNAPGSPVMDIWNRGAAAGTAADAEVSSRAAGTAVEEEQATSQLPVHMVVPGTEPNMQSERLRVGPGAGTAAAAASAGTAADVTAPADVDAVAADGKDAGDDMFAEDDMFAAEGDVDAAAAAPKRGPAVPAGLMDNYDDAEGYYNFQVGEVLDGRYEVFACKGKGVFSTVLRARDLNRQISSLTGAATAGVGAGPLAPGTEHPEVAIKVIRSNETMAKAAALEQRILRILADKDPENRKHVIRLLRTFEFRHHVCMVFEPLDMNLRELTLKYGRNVGLNITAVAIYAGQMLVALRHLQQCRVLHADIKPDNILVNARRSKVKICDLGSAMLAGENERTPYLVSRFYRAPEVVLGLAYDFAMDMWSVGCVLYELFTGKILFPGRTNNEMLKLMMDVKGPFPKKMLKKGIFVEKHFEDDTQLSFALVEEDPVTKQPVRRVIPNPVIKHNFSQLFARAEGDRVQVAALADLLEKMLALDPEKRITPDAALRHPFVKPWLPKKKTAAL